MKISGYKVNKSYLELERIRYGQKIFAPPARYKNGDSLLYL